MERVLEKSVSSNVRRLKKQNLQKWRKRRK